MIRQTEMFFPRTTVLKNDCNYWIPGQKIIQAKSRFHVVCVLEWFFFGVCVCACAYVHAGPRVRVLVYACAWDWEGEMH